MASFLRKSFVRTRLSKSYNGSINTALAVCMCDVHGRQLHSHSGERREPMGINVGRTPVNCTTALEAVNHIKSGSNVFVQGMAATPNLLTAAMTEHGISNHLKDVSVYHLHTDGPCPYVSNEAVNHFNVNSFFLGSNVRKETAISPQVNYIPVFLCETAALFRRGVVKLDVALVQVSPPDAHGYCSLGTSVDATRAALQCAKVRVGQINSNMPRTYGDGIVHISNFDYVWNHDAPIHINTPAPITEVEDTIGKLIAENLVVDGATLQMGIGSIPNATLTQLKGHRNLGIHSEMFSDGVLDLVELGVVNGMKKSMRQGLLVSTFLTGSQRLYDFVNDNPVVDMCDVEFTNDPYIIAKQNKMTAINSCIEIDLTGQVAADSIGTKIYSGVGGQVDFLRGASLCEEGGCSILAFPSRTKKGENRIVPFLKEGAGVVTTRAHVQHVVTEYGVVNLLGKNLRQRALALIGIAHPDDREDLYNAARERLLVD